MVDWRSQIEQRLLRLERLQQIDTQKFDEHLSSLELSKLDLPSRPSPPKQLSTKALEVQVEQMLAKLKQLGIQTT